MSIPDLNVGMVVRLMDQFSGPGTKIKGAMKSLKAEARGFKEAWKEGSRVAFSDANLDAALMRRENKVRASRQRLVGAFGMAIALGAPVLSSGNFEEELIHFANLAELPLEKVKKLKGEFKALREITGKGNLQLLEGLSNYVGKGMGVDEAMAALGATGRSATATRSEIEMMANAGFAVMDNLKVAPDLMDKAFNVMAKSGKEGSFELGAMARKFPEITAGAKSLKMEGVAAVASLSAALQIAMKSAGSEDQAATNMSNFLGKITAPDTVRKFQKFGVNIEKEMQIAAKRGSDPLEHMLLVIEKMTGGDSFKMGQLFQDKQVLDFLRALIPNMKEYQRIKEEAGGADGVIDKDFEAVMKGFNEQGRQLWNDIKSLLGTSSVLLPVFTEIIVNTRAMVAGVAEWTMANPELTATLIKGGAALLAFGIGTRVLGFAFATMSHGILRTAALFWRFNDAGKNVSVVGRAMRAAGWSGGFLFRRLKNIAWLLGTPLKWGKFLPRFAVSSIVKPLAWTARLVPAIGWAALAGKLGWKSLLVPLKWGGRLIPVIGWALLAGELAWHLIIKPLGWDEYITKENMLAAWDKVRGYLKWTALISPIGWAAFLSSDTLEAAWRALNGELSWSDVFDTIDWSDELGIDSLKAIWADAMSYLKLPSWMGGGDGYEPPTEAVPSITKAMASQNFAGTSDIARPEAASQPMRLGPAPAPVHHNTFENKPIIKVVVPLQVHKTQQATNKKISEDAGREVARATRRALDDADISE